MDGSLGTEMVMASEIVSRHATYRDGLHVLAALIWGEARRYGGLVRKLADEIGPDLSLVVTPLCRCRAWPDIPAVSR